MQPGRPLGGLIFSVGLTLGLASAGCVGSVGDGRGGSVPGGPSMTETPATGNPGLPNSGDPTGPGYTPPPPPPPPPKGACGAPSFATLLTRDQYVNTVSDLMGQDVRSLVAFKDASGRKYRADGRLSPLQAEGFQQTAQAVADLVATPANLAKLLPCDPTKVEESKCADQFIERFGSRALRRPLAADYRSDLRELYDGGRQAGGFATGIQWVVDAVLQSPEFLYHLVLPVGSPAPGAVVSLDDFEIAARLAYFLWNSAPDEELWAIAAKGQLRTAAQIEAQVDRLRKDARATRTREDFYRGWLNLDLLGSLLREDPAYTPELAQKLEKSLLAGINDHYAKDGSAEALFSSSTVFMDDTLSRLYGSGGAPAPAGADLRPTTVSQSQRRGLFTHPAVMTLLAEHDTSDPIRRGIFVFKKVLCQSIPDPPDGVPDLPPLATNLTTRQRLVAHRDAPQCRACHAAFEPMGLAFENFDHLGRFRTEEHGMKIDSSAEVNDGGLDLQGNYADGFAFLDRLAKSASARGCIAEQWYEYGLSRDIAAADSCSLPDIKAKFAASGDLNQLLASIALGDTFRNRLVGQE